MKFPTLPNQAAMNRLARAQHDLREARRRALHARDMHAQARRRLKLAEREFTAASLAARAGAR